MYGSTFCDGKFIRGTTLFGWIDVVFTCMAVIVVDLNPYFGCGCRCYAVWVGS
jgi:hypothetical protein